MKNENIIRDSPENLTYPYNHELKFLQKYRSFDDVTWKIVPIISHNVSVFRGGSGPATSNVELVKVVNGF